MAEEMDPCSFTSFQKYTTKHLNLRWHLNFKSRIIQGSAALTIEVLEQKLSNLILDTKDLKIFKILVNGQKATFSLGPKHWFKGSPLEITPPFQLERGQQAVVEIFYETCPEASALQWLNPEQTAGKRHPFLFSQCQFIHCRSITPCQDTPAVKQTYYAQVSAPKELIAVMSAICDGDEPDCKDSKQRILQFRQKIPIPSYLIAIVVGALESREIGPRSRLWAEKEAIEKAAFEFAQTETMLKTAESLVGPYLWERYDLLVLPPSFPYGAMENPCLMYVTPTSIAGDRSLADGISHEIAHCWMGNLVTNKTWEHFWLNEGHAVYIERVISGRMYNEKCRQFAAIGGWNYLCDSIKTLGKTNKLTNLVPNLAEVDPDEAFSCVPYEKGFALLYHLEQLLGGQDVFIKFLHAYVWKFAFKSITTDDWKTFLYDYFKDKADVLNKVNWDAWMNTPGMPPAQPQYDTTLADKCTTLSQRWSKAKESELYSFSSADIEEMTPLQLIEFLSQLLLKDPLPLKHVQRMQDVYSFNAVTNMEIRFRWLRLCLRSKWDNAVPLALRMVTEQGRLKFTRPLFRDLYDFTKFRQEAINAYMKYKQSMHPCTALLVGRDLHLLQEELTAAF
ncbi:leukotriene A-4 hydrolase-like [Protopterus annectens]|uniref:leukotriene A-4 hydrolase-like n=1 Tax=Protopterus annectens TaxID=7888 RepID=UPI001CF9F288|nr:leukotriene A-4 hydrolase-like [Protopterus annectens]